MEGWRDGGMEEWMYRGMETTNGNNNKNKKHRKKNSSCALIVFYFNELNTKFITYFQFE